jgi:hypothetical protein
LITGTISRSQKARIAVDAPRLYPLPATGEPATAERLLTLVPAAPGLAVYSFTFRACAPLPLHAGSAGG